MEYFELSNGNKIPSIGTGPSAVYRRMNDIKLRWKWVKQVPLVGNFAYRVYYHFKVLSVSHQWVNVLSESLKTGYRLIDYSNSYGDGKLIMKAIKKSGVERKDIFIISRASNPKQVSHQVREEFIQSLSNLGVDYIDLYMFHWPVPDCYIETYREIEKLYKEGLVKNIGICNCHQHHIDAILKECEIKPVVNEIEVHPLFTQKPLVKYCQEHGIRVIAYTPLAINDYRLRNSKILRGIAEKYHKNFCQIVLRWHIQNGVIPIPYSFNPKHNQSNFEVFDFELAEEEIKVIDGFNYNCRLRYDPDNCDFSIL